ncbi:MAG: hypothetical protein Q9196_003410 [Gyalolechia fulgens]
MEIPQSPTLHVKGQQHPPWYVRKRLWPRGEYQFCHAGTANMVLSKEDLLAHSRYIRDTLVPRIAKDETIVSEKHAFDLTHLRSALEELHNSPMTIEILNFSRIEKALQKIAESHGDGWPPDIVSKAKDLIARWEGSLGPLLRVRTDIWGTGGRLEGFARPEEHVDYMVRMKLSIGKPELIRRRRYQRPPAGQSSKGATSAKHTSMDIQGSRLETCRDGIVDNPQSWVTADDDVAYAVMMADHTESNVGQDDSCSYIPDPGDPGVFKLMATINGEKRNPVRVIRSWRLDSRLAPTAGIRYDGLCVSPEQEKQVKIDKLMATRYRVTGYSIKLNHELEGDRWSYTFHLQREPGQDSMEKALMFPNSEQLDDWNDYISGAKRVPEDEAMEETFEGILGGDQCAAERLGSIDSGYFSPHPTALKGEVFSP